MTSQTIEPGLLLVDKPAGATSHDVVNAARRALGVRRIGHTGTLDPFATGLLLLCVGSFTRATEYFHGLSKTYRAVMRLGVETDTEDATGEAVARSDAWTELSSEAIAGEVSGLIGSHEQMPPAFSAKKVSGVRAYDLARSGRTVELETSPITVHAARVTRMDPPDVGVEVEVSTGTYVRSLARDLGRSLGCGAHLSSLRRTAIGPFVVEDAVASDQMGSALGDTRAWRPAASALPWLGRRPLDDAETVEVEHGRFLPADESESGRLALVRGERLVAIGEVVDGRIRPRKVFLR